MNPTPWRNTADRYGRLSIGMHWLMVLLLAAVFATMELRGNFPKGSDAREVIKTWHYMLGLSVLALVAVRLLLRWSDGTTPRISPEPPDGQARLATVAHVGLYVLMVAMPLLGWWTLSAQGKAIPFFGLQLPPLVGEDKALADWAKEIHETGATIGYVLIGAHALAALYHHHVVRDDTLRRMLPGRG